MAPTKKRPRSPPAAILLDNQSSSYSGFTLNASAHLDRLDASTIEPAKFFADYVAQRRPCILTNHGVHVTVDRLVEIAGDLELEVEKRPNTSAHFGQNRTRERQVGMTLRALTKAWDGPDRALFYLSTQQETAESSIMDSPCQRLVDHDLLPTQLPYAGHLGLASAHLWMGAAEGSSGLHHDFHDNFYLLLSGTKQFRLYAPTDYPYMELYGQIQGMHTNGLLSYTHNPTRSDGVPLSVLKDKSGAEVVGDESSDEEEDGEVVLGRGFDYQSDGDSEHPDGDGSDDYETYVEGHGVGDKREGYPSDARTKVTQFQRPGSFSRIDPTEPRATLQRDHADFASCRECIVDLQAGEAIYLPASWFHCVTSKLVNGKVHMALNYWYHPPDQLDSFSCPYRYGYWTSTNNKN